MNLRAQINYWLSLHQMTYNKLADKMTELSGRKYTGGGINAKLIRGTLTFKEFELIASIFGCRLEIKEIQRSCGNPA